MKIAYIITGLACGGAEAQLATVCRNLKCNHEIVVYSIAENRDLLSRFEGVTVKFFPLKSFRNLIGIYNDLRIFNPDVIHSHMIHSNIIAPFLSKVLGKPCVITSHNTNEGGGLRFFILRLVVLLFKPHVTHVSKKGANSYIKKKLTPSVDIYTNPVSLSDFSCGKDTRNENVVWINVASLTDQKNHERLIFCFEKLIAHFPDDQLIIVGSGPNEESCMEQICALGIESNVKLLGSRNDINSLLGSSDYFVLSSDWEGLPVSAVEALSSKVPVVSTNCGDLDTIITNGYNGFLSNLSTSDFFQTMLIARTVDDNTYFELAANAKKSINKFDIDNVVERLEQKYFSMVSKR
ncbi:glycosyltransferase [Vibrio astriarenae]